MTENDVRLARMLELRCQVAKALTILSGQAQASAVDLGLAGVVGILRHVAADLRSLARDLDDRIQGASAERRTP